MTFVEITEGVMAGVVQAPGHPDDEKAIREALPSMAGYRSWGSRHGGYTWVIGYEPGRPDWSDEVKRRFIGFTASYRRACQGRSSETIRIDGGPWQTLAEAEKACRDQWRAVRSAH